MRFSRRAKMGLALCGFLTGLVGLEFYRSALGDHRTEWGPDITVVASFSTASPEIAVGKIADPSDGVTSLDSGVGNPTGTGGMSDVKPTVDETVTVAETVAPPSGAPELTVAALSSEQVPASPPSTFQRRRPPGK